MLCTCPRAALCAACLADVSKWVGGPASRRAVTWAQRVAAQRSDLWPLPWPAHEGRAAVIALRWVHDLTSDPRVQQVGALACSAAAADWWARGCCPAQDSARVHAGWCRRGERAIGKLLPGRFG